MRMVVVNGGGTPDPTKGVVFEDFDEYGYPQRIRFVGNYEFIPNNYLCFGDAASIPTSEMSYNFVGRIKTLEIPNGVTEIRENAFERWFGSENLILPSSLTGIKQMAFRYFGSKISAAVSDLHIPPLCEFPVNSQQQFRYSKFKRVIFDGTEHPSYITGFDDCGSTEVFDFSKFTIIPQLRSTGSFQPASGCVIKVPQALLADWQNATNWADLTDVVWQGV